MSLRAGRCDALQPLLRDLDQIRAFLSGGGPLAYSIYPGLPLYLAYVLPFHFWIGIAALVGASVLIRPCGAKRNDVRTARDGRRLYSEPSQRSSGISRRPMPRWSRARNGANNFANLGGEINTKFIAKSGRPRHCGRIRSDLKGCCGCYCNPRCLPVGAYLVIQQQSTAGIIIAGSIFNGAGVGTGRTSYRQLAGFSRRQAKLDASAANCFALSAGL